MGTSIRRARRAAWPALLAAAFAAAAWAETQAAPLITELMAGGPPHAQADATIGIFGSGFVAPLQVFFSDGTNPTVSAGAVAADTTRGILMVRVPAGAATGNMKVVANGVDSNLFYFRRDAGTFARGASLVSGQVFGPSLAPVAGAVVVLLAPSGCDGETLWDHSVTDASGNYTLHGQPAGEYMLFAFPPRATNLAVSGAQVSAPVTQPLPVPAGTVVNGRVVLASSPGTGVANARVEFEGEGFDTPVTDASGNYSVVLQSAAYQVRATPPPSAVLARSQEVALNVGASSPQSAANIALDGGVRIYGIARRQADSAPMPGVYISAWPNNGGGNGIETVAAGDGSYALVVPANTSYSVNVSVEESEPYYHAQLDNVAVAASDVPQNLSLLDAGFIRGTVTDASSSGMGDMQVVAHAVPWGNAYPVTQAHTCEDGSYTLHVPPSASGYIVSAAESTNGSQALAYVPAAYRSSGGSTFYICEGTAVPVPAVGSVVAGIDVALKGEAGTIEGSILTQSSGCTAPFAQQVLVQVDDGTAHACSLGVQDWTQPSGSYRTFGLPNLSFAPIVRACIAPYGPGSAICYDAKTYPQYTSLPLPPGGSQSGVDFCVGAALQPATAVGHVVVAKSAGQLTLTWNGTGDPATSAYRVRGAISARPATAPGSFPNDPGFTDLWNGPATSASLALTTPYAYFLVTPVGSTGLEGPSQHYPNAP